MQAQETVLKFFTLLMVNPKRLDAIRLDLVSILN